MNELFRVPSDFGDNAYLVVFCFSSLGAVRGQRRAPFRVLNLRNLLDILADADDDEIPPLRREAGN
eukprot:7378240-Pyramimonas_sp.AAC.1